MHKAVRILLYIVSSIMMIIGAVVFGYGMVIPAIAATAFFLFGALFFIGGIIVIYATSRDAKKESVKHAYQQKI